MTDFKKYGIRYDRMWPIYLQGGRRDDATSNIPPGFALAASKIMMFYPVGDFIATFLPQFCTCEDSDRVRFTTALYFEDSARVKHLSQPCLLSAISFKI